MKTQALLSLPSILLKHCCKVRKIYHKIFGYIFLKSNRINNSSNANIYHWSLLCLRRHAKDLMHIIVLLINHPLQTVLLLSPFYRWWLRLREMTSLTQVHTALPQDQDSTTPKHTVLTSVLLYLGIRNYFVVVTSHKLLLLIHILLLIFRGFSFSFQIFNPPQKKQKKTPQSFFFILSKYRWLWLPNL